MGRPSSPRIDEVSLEVAALAQSLAQLLERPGSQPTESVVWPVYARTEALVGRLKYRLGAERPGLFSELPRSKVPLEFLSRASEHLGKAAAESRTGELAPCLESLRGARTCLRAYLAELTRVRARERRKSSVSRRASSSS